MNRRRGSPRCTYLHSLTDVALRSLVTSSMKIFETSDSRGMLPDLWWNHMHIFYHCGVIHCAEFKKSG